MKSEEIDGVVITLPRRLTANVVAEALNADKHVLLKNLALGLETGRTRSLSRIEEKSFICRLYETSRCGLFDYWSEFVIEKLGANYPYIRSNCYG